MVEVALERAPPGRSQPIVGLGEPSFEVFIAGNVTRFLELARVNAEVSVGRAQQSFEVIEAERLIHRQRADDPKPHPLVDQPVQIGAKLSGASPWTSRRSRGSRL